jgi:hypothetical protein
VRRWLGASFVILGFAVLVIDVPYLDVTVLTLTSRHGVELTDLIGAAALLVGVLMLWQRLPAVRASSRCLLEADG